MDASSAPCSPPTMETVGVLVIIAAVIGIIYAAVRHTKVARARRAANLSESLGKEDPEVVVNPDTGVARATVRGLPLRFHFTSRGSGSSSESWTEVEVDVPHEPLVLSLRLQTKRDWILVRDGLAVDIQLGDPEFDEKYLVEGAPAAIATRVLDPAVRRKLLLDEPNEVETRPFGVLVARKGWREAPADIQSLADLAVSIAQNIAPAIAESRKAEAPPPESAYRGPSVSAADHERWEAAKRDLAARQAAEVAALAATRARRTAAQGRNAAIAVAFILLFAGVAWAITSAK